MQNTNLLQLRLFVWYFHRLESTLDTAMRLAQRGWLAEWQSVQAGTQTAGRGQLRRQWASPEGNIYVSLRLPQEPPFDGTAAAPATALMLALALRREGWPVRIKWPNDIVLLDRNDVLKPRKLAGVLLEERAGVLLAGMGINVCHAPADALLRADAAMRATCLEAFSRENAPPAREEASQAARDKKDRERPLRAEALWSRLVKHMYSIYSDASAFSARWQAQVQALLLWRGCSVELLDGATAVRGLLQGVSPRGGIVLTSAEGSREFFSGSLRPCAARFFSDQT